MILNATIAIPKEAVQKIEKKASIAPEDNVTVAEILETEIAEFLMKTYHVSGFGTVVVDIHD